MLLTTVGLIVIYQFIFAANCSFESIAALIYPPSIAWVGCFVGGFIVGEVVRRYLNRKIT